MQILIFQHSEAEHPGTILPWAASRGHATRVLRIFEELPAPGEGADLLVVLGGPMNVDQTERHPWLLEEKRFLKDWVDAERPVLGICLGGQLLAQALGGVVRRASEREIGFHRVTRTEREHPALRRWPAGCEVYQFHEDSFSLPAGCELLLRSAACPHQAFARGPRVLGLQFHPESSAAWIRGNAASVSRAEGERYVELPAETERRLPVLLPPMTRHFHELLDDFTESLGCHESTGK